MRLRTGEERVECADALLDSVDVGVQPLKWQRLRLGELVDTVWVLYPGTETLVESPRLFRSGHNDYSGDIQVFEEGAYQKRD